MKIVSKQTGFTLMEIVVGMALLSTTTILATISYASISRLQQHGAAVRGVQQNSRYVLEAVARDIRNSTSICIVIGPGNCVTTPGTSGTGMQLSSSYLGDQTLVTYSFTPAPTYQIDRLSCDVVTDPTCATAVAQPLATDVVVKNVTYTLEIVNTRSYVVIDMDVQELDNAGLGINQNDPYFKDYQLSTVVAPRGQE
ncbi:MAG: PilW family protein [Candidatus Saccharimonadia bacterium]